MTRNEEILKQFNVRPMPMKDILKAMDISNREVAIGFVDWTWDNGWVRCFYDGKYHGYYNPNPNDPENESDEITREQLFEKYLQ